MQTTPRATRSSPPTTELSFAEDQLWRVDQAGCLAAPFVDCAPSLSIVVRLKNSLNHDALEAGIDEIVRRHDVLRSRFVARTGGVTRLCAPPIPIRLTTIDVRRMSDDGVRHVLVDHVERRFDLTSGPLLRARLLALADDEHVLAITVHHIVFDRWSTRVFVQELKELYEAYVTKRTPSLEPLKVRYHDYVQWQRDRLDGELGRVLTRYWTTRLSGLSDLVLPCDGVRNHVPSTRAGTYRFVLPAADVDRLGIMSRRCRVPLATTMLAVFTLFLHRLSGQDDIAVGVPLSDRRHPDFEALIGLFMNVVVVRAAVTSHMTFLNLLDGVRRALVDACRYQDLPYGYLLQIAGTRNALFRVAFNFMPPVPASELELLGLDVVPLTIAAESQALADLSLHVRHNAGALTCRFLYKADLFSPHRVQQFATQLQTLVRGVMDEPATCVGAYDLHSDDPGTLARS